MKITQLPLNSRLIIYRKWAWHLYYWKNAYSSCFYDYLFDLISKADEENLEILRLSYSMAIKVFEDYKINGEKFFINLQIPKANHLKMK